MSEGACWEGWGVCAESGHFGSQLLAYGPGVVGRLPPVRPAERAPPYRPGVAGGLVCLVADRAHSCPIGWDVFGDEPGPRTSRARGPAGLASGHTSGLRYLNPDRGWAGVQGNRTGPNSHPRTWTACLRMDCLPADGLPGCGWTAWLRMDHLKRALRRSKRRSTVQAQSPVQVRGRQPTGPATTTAKALKPEEPLHCGIVAQPPVRDWSLVVRRRPGVGFCCFGEDRCNYRGKYLYGELSEGC